MPSHRPMPDPQPRVTPQADPQRSPAAAAPADTAVAVAPESLREPEARASGEPSPAVPAPRDSTAPDGLVDAPGQVPGTPAELQALADPAVALVRDWLGRSARTRPDRDAARLAALLKDANGLDFTLGFVDRVVRPEDVRVAAHDLRRLSDRVPRFLPWYLRAAVLLGGRTAPVLPWIVVPLARRALRHLVSHLVIDASPARLQRSLEHLRGTGARLNINLLGEAVIGDAESERRLVGTRELLARDDVDYVSIKVSNVAAQLSMWAFDETVERIVQRLTPLYRDAASAASAKFVNLDMEEYRDLDLTMAVFTRLLDQPELRGLEAGIVLQAYLPDALGALDRLTAWAQRRRAEGGAPIKVRVVKGANLAMEHVDAAVHEWPQAPFHSKRETDTNYKRMLDAGMTRKRTDAVKLGVAGHNLFDIAFALLLAQQRGVADRIDVEMLLGMATAQQQAVRESAGGLLLYTPVVHPDQFDAAIGYLVRRLEENSSAENFMSAAFDLGDNALFSREEHRFRESLAAVLIDPQPEPNRRQDRTAAALPEHPEEPEPFENEPDTDPALAANRSWGRELLARSAASEAGLATLAAASVTDAATLEQRVADAVAAGVAWGRRPASERAVVLESVADVLAVMRGRLIEVMAAETGKTIAEADVEVSEAVDFARWYAARAIELEEVQGAEFAPTPLTVAAPPWNFPVSIPAGSVLAPLAAGGAVLLKPAPQARRSGAVLAEAFAEAGVPRDLVGLIDVEEGELGRALITHPAVGRVILTGAYDTAALFRSWKPDLTLQAETSGKNAIIVTPSADLDLAVADIVKSAFSNAGQKCSAASLVILVGSVGRSERFRRQLVDAARTMRVALPQDPTAQIGPLVEAPTGKLQRGLTELGRGERWLVQPEPVAGDASGRLWSPGIRTGVQPGSDFHLTEYFGPVLGVMRARTLDEAVRLQNAVPYGLTAGLHSLDPVEIEHWVDRVEAGNLYVNRGITGAIVGRQPFGGWKRSSVGAGAKAGGPNTLLTLGEWHAVDSDGGRDLRLDGIDPRVRRIVESVEQELVYDEYDVVRTAALRDTDAWLAEFGHTYDLADLGVERNLFRYRPVAVQLRLAERAPVHWLVRELAAAALVGAPVLVSSAVPLPDALSELIAEDPGVCDIRQIVIEPDTRFTQRAAAGIRIERIRLLGGDGAALARAIEGSPDTAILAGEVSTAGRVELLTFLREQSVSITAHRFGNPDRAALALHV